MMMLNDNPNAAHPLISSLIWTNHQRILKNPRVSFLQMGHRWNLWRGSLRLLQPLSNGGTAIVTTISVPFQHTAVFYHSVAVPNRVLPSGPFPAESIGPVVCWIVPPGGYCYSKIHGSTRGQGKALSVSRIGIFKVSNAWTTCETCKKWFEKNEHACSVDSEGIYKVSEFTACQYLRASWPDSDKSNFV